MAYKEGLRIGINIETSVLYPIRKAYFKMKKNLMWAVKPKC
jgi:hypothetical protein